MMGERRLAPVARGVERFCIGAKFSFAHQKRTRKVPAISTRWIRRVAVPSVHFVPWAALVSC